MMDEPKLRNNIRKSLKAKGIDLTEKEINNLYALTITNMQDMLDEGKTLDISEFGSLWRKNIEPASVTFFKPTERLLERINTSKK